MTGERALAWAVVAAAAACVASLTVLIARTFRFRPRPSLASPAGSGTRGIVWAFGEGMLPSAKESARLHRAVFAMGTLYHLGVFAGLAWLAAAVAGSARVPLGAILRGTMVVGVASGIGLFARRLALPHLRRLSTPDDYAANLLVDSFLVAAIADSLTPGARVPFFVISLFMLLYVPVGKIRHCVFFFFSRILFGLFFGRRGVIPHPRPHGA